jgi:hypothetical protein
MVSYSQKEIQIYQKEDQIVWKISALASKMGQIKKIKALYYIKS